MLTFLLASLISFSDFRVFIAMMRVQGKTKQLNDGHPVMDQIQRVKLRYMKLNEAVKEQDKS